MIKSNQAQAPTTLFECTFNNVSSGDCSFNVNASMGVPNNTLHIDAGQNFTNSTSPPDRPLSDATSVFSLTKSNGTCNFPRQTYGWNLSFCTTVAEPANYTCLTSSNETQECVNGLYAYLSANKSARYEANITSRVISPPTPTEYQCLTFYYFFTNNKTNASIDVTWQASPSSSGNSSIVTVIPQPESKWYKSEVSFNVSYANYTLQFGFSLESNLSDTDLFFFAIDDISVKNGSCATGTTTTTTEPSTPTSTTTSALDTTTTPSGGTTTTSDTLTTTTAGSDGSTTTTPSQTTSTPKMDTTTTIADDMENTTVSSNNFGVIHGLSFGMGVLTILMYFIIIV